MTQDIVTTNLADFGRQGLRMTRDLLDAMIEQGLPEGFELDGVTVMFNRHSGNVFLTNSEYQTAMMNGDKLEEWFYCGECGKEGFAKDIEWDAENHICGECTPRRR